MNDINNIIYRRLNGKTRLRRVEAIIVKAVDGSNETKYEISYFEESDQEKKRLILLNKSNDVLSEGDHVWIHYWNTVSDGYIAIKTGLSDFGINDDTPIQRPIHSETTVGAAYRFCKGDSIHSDYYSYSDTEQESLNGRFNFEYGNMKLVSVLRHQQGNHRLVDYYITRYNFHLYNNSTVEASILIYNENPSVGGQLETTDGATVYDDQEFPLTTIDNDSGEYIISYERIYIDFDIPSSSFQLIGETNGYRRIFYTFNPSYYTMRDHVGFFLKYEVPPEFHINKFLDTDDSRGCATARLYIYPAGYNAELAKWVPVWDSVATLVYVVLKRNAYNVQSVNHIIAQQHTSIDEG